MPKQLLMFKKRMISLGYSLSLSKLSNGHYSNYHLYLIDIDDNEIINMTGSLITILTALKERGYV